MIIIDNVLVYKGILRKHKRKSNPGKGLTLLQKGLVINMKTGEIWKIEE